jgi:hypothetical protein
MYVRALIALILINITKPALSISLVKNKWYSIQTNCFKIIFPRGFYSEANKMANLMEKLNTTINNKVTSNRLPVIIDNKICIPNAQFTSSPSKIIFYTFPSHAYSFIGAVDWFELTAIHEYRHYIQYENFNKYGLSKLINRTLGFSPMAYLIPNWLLEGDSVGLETIHTKGGRGRHPQFTQLYRMHLLEARKLDYYQYIYMCGQEYNKYKMPNWYSLGYYMSTYLKRTYGNEIIDKVLNTSGKYLLPFEIALKIETGKILGRDVTYENLLYRFLNKYRKKSPLFDNLLNFKEGVWMKKAFAEANKELYKLYNEQITDIETTNVEEVHSYKGGKNEIVNYILPHICPTDGSIITIKYGLRYPEQFVIIKNNKEKKLFELGSIENGHIFSYANDLLAWSRQVPHLTKGKILYSVIFTYNLKTKKLKKLTHKTKYKDPCISPKGDKIVVIETDKYYKHAIVIINSANGEVITKLPNPENLFYTNPIWTNDGESIIAIKSKDQKQNLVIIHPIKPIGPTPSTSFEIKDLHEPSNVNIGHPTIFKNYILYNASYDGMDNIYALDLDSKQIYQVTCRKYGSYNPRVSPCGQWIYFNDFTIHGRTIVKIPFNTANWHKLEDLKDRHIDYYKPMLNGGKLLFDIKKPILQYKALPYKPIIQGGYIQILPDTEVSPTTNIPIRINAHDLLNDLSYSFSYIYNTQQGVNKINLTASSRLFIPEIFCTLSANSFRVNPSMLDLTSNIGLKLPLNFLWRSCSAKIEFIVFKEFSLEKKLWENITTQIIFKNANYNWGQKVDFTAKIKNYKYIKRWEAVFSLKTALFFPGILKQASIKVQLENIFYTNKLSLKANKNIAEYIYMLPLFYPNCSITPLFYLKRIDLKVGYKHSIPPNFGSNNSSNLLGKNIKITLKPHFNILSANIIYSDIEIGAVVNLESFTINYIFELNTN